jgi:HEPN domain-containing protein
VPDDALGFHVQQAIEKRMKAVLAFNEVEFQHTHSIGYLTTLMEHHGIEAPEDREQLEDLTPWAVDARYGDELNRLLDRPAVRKLVASVRRWSRRLLSEEPRAKQGEPEGAGGSTQLSDKG